MDSLRKIVELSCRDTVDCGPWFESNPSVVPEDLLAVLENNVETYDNITEAGQHYLTILEGLSSFTEIDKDMYWYLWKLLLYLEQYQGIVECRCYSLYGKKLEKAKVRKGEFVLYVPGLQEDRPSLRPRDCVDIKPVNGTEQSVGEIKFVGDNYISIVLDITFRQTWRSDRLYDISFRWSDWENNNLNLAIDKVQKFNLMRMIFPTGGKYNNAKHEKLTWINKNIEANTEQQQAIYKILSKSCRPDPYILFGPPGTGKTSTLIEAILQIHLQDPASRILICTPSNSAADEIALKLLNHSPAILPEGGIYRLYSASRNMDDIHESLKVSSNRATDNPVYLSELDFIAKHIVIVTLATAIRVYNYGLEDDHFSYLFIDEAGQATEPQTLMPLLTMCGYDPEINGYPHGQVVIAGDPKQLGPSCNSKLAEPLLAKSMLERLMSCGPYRRLECGGYDSNYVTKLVQNYRCHPAILEVPNKLFYHGELVPRGGSHTQRAINWPHLPNKQFPVIFHGVQGAEERERHSPSVFNPYEVHKIVEYVMKLTMSRMGGRLVKQEDIGIVTPYKLQRKKIIEALKKKNIDNISVGTVEIFQGQEKDIIIISTVRSVLYRTAAGRVHIGFLSNPKRFNVAVTRAKSLLIVIGNPRILQHDECWKEFMQYCWDNKAWVGKKHLLDDYISQRQISRLLAKKHQVVPTWDPNDNLPVVEDPISANDYRRLNRGGERRRRAPVLMEGEESSVSSESGVHTEEIDYWPEGLNVSDWSSWSGETTIESEIEDDTEYGSADSDEIVPRRVPDNSRLYSAKYNEPDITFNKLYKRMQAM